MKIIVGSVLVGAVLGDDHDEPVCPLYQSTAAKVRHLTVALPKSCLLCWDTRATLVSIAFVYPHSVVLARRNEDTVRHDMKRTSIFAVMSQACAWIPSCTVEGCDSKCVANIFGENKLVKSLESVYQSSMMCTLVSTMVTGASFEGDTQSRRLQVPLSMLFQSDACQHHVTVHLLAECDIQHAIYLQNIRGISATQSSR